MGRSQRPVWLGQDQRGWDHVRIHIQLLYDGRLGPYELTVYSALVWHAELASGDARPAKDTLAVYGRAASSNTAMNALRILEDCGYIETRHRPGKASLYRVLPPPPLPPAHDLRALTGRRGAHDLRASELDDAHEERGSGERVAHDERGSRASGARGARTACAPGRASDARERDPRDENQRTRARDDEQSAEARPARMVAEARELCEQLADSIGERGARRPRVSPSWVNDMERLLRLDGIEPEHVARVIAWLHNGGDAVASFWRPNIRSPRKLRANWDQMREQFERQRRRGSREAAVAGSMTVAAAVPDGVRVLDAVFRASPPAAAVSNAAGPMTPPSRGPAP